MNWKNANATGSRRLRGRVGHQYGVVEVVLWSCVLLFYALGDTGLTILVIELGGYEANPLTRAFVETAGYTGLVVQKTLVVGVLGAVWRYYPTVGDLSPDPWRLVVPAVATVYGIHLVTAHVGNIAVLV